MSKKYWNRSPNTSSASQRQPAERKRHPDAVLAVPGTEVELSHWVAEPGSRDAGASRIGIDRVSFADDGTKRRYRTFRVASEDLVGVTLGLVNVFQHFAADNTLANNVRKRYERLAIEVGDAVARVMDPSKTTARQQPGRRATSLAATSANGQATLGKSPFGSLG